MLHEAVGRFPALPAGDPGRSDAAYCLFLHVQAITRRWPGPEWPGPEWPGPEWPAVAAGVLGIGPASAGGPVRSAEGQGAEPQETDGQS